MKLVSMSAVKDLAIKALNPRKADLAAKEAVKGGEELMAAGQDASANYGKAMVSAPKFEKPAMERANIKRCETKAASGGDGFDPGFDPEGGGFPSAAGRAYYDGGREYSDFEREVSGLIDDLGF